MSCACSRIRTGRIRPRGAEDKIYEHARPSRSGREELFVAEVSQIVWKYKLSPETINLPARHGVQRSRSSAVALKTGNSTTKCFRAHRQGDSVPDRSPAHLSTTASRLCCGL